MNAVAEARQLATLVNAALEQVSELRGTVERINAKREQLRLKACEAILRERCTRARTDRVQRVYGALDQLCQPLSGVDLRAGNALSDADIGSVTTQIESWVKGETI